MNLIKQIPIEKLVRSNFQPRKVFNEHELQELAETIKTTNGLLQPIIVREQLGLDEFEIIAGERRWRAAMLAGLQEVSCIITAMNDKEALQAAIIENVSRADLNVIEEAEAYQRLADEFGYTHEQIAISVGKSRTKITNIIRMLKLHPGVKNFIVEGLLSEGHGKILVTLAHDMQFSLAKKIIEKGWSVRRIEKEVKSFLSKSVMQINEKKGPDILALERGLSDHIGCSVSILVEQNQGKLEINFHNLEVLQGLFDRLGFNIDT